MTFLASPQQDRPFFGQRSQDKNAGLDCRKHVDAARRHAPVQQLEPLLALAAADDHVDPGRQSAIVVHPRVEGVDVPRVVHHDDNLQVHTPGTGETVVAILLSRSREIGRLTNAGFSLVDRGAA